MIQIIPKPSPEIQERYAQHCVKSNLTLIWYFSALALLIFGLHLAHHLRLGADIFSASMFPYTLLYSFNIFYAALNMWVLPKMRNTPALNSIIVLLEVAYPFFMGLVFAMLGVIGVIQQEGPAPYVAGMLIISVMLQGHYTTLLALFGLSWVVFTVTLVNYVSIEKATSSIMIGFTVSLAAAGIARLIEMSRLNQFELSEKLEEKNQLLEEMSNSDPLTSLNNRRHFTELLETEISRTVRYNHPLGLLLMDIDDFKKINDRLGHVVGDQLICEVASLIKSQQRELDLVCRYGGDEFSVLLIETNTEQAVEVAERIRAVIHSHKFAGIEHPVTLSIGHTQFRGQASNKFIDCADRMLRESKKRGKNHVSTDSH